MFRQWEILLHSRLAWKVSDMACMNKNGTYVADQMEKTGGGYTDEGIGCAYGWKRRGQKRQINHNNIRQNLGENRLPTGWGRKITMLTIPIITQGKITIAHFLQNWT